MTYFRKSGLKMRQRHAETGDVEDLSDMGSDQIDEEIRQSQEPGNEAQAGEGRGRRRAAVNAMKKTRKENAREEEAMAEMDDDESDCSFDADKQSVSDEEDGEEEFDEDMESEVQDDDVNLESPKKKKK